MLLRFKLLIAAVLLGSAGAIAWLAYSYIVIGGFTFWLPQKGAIASTSIEWANFGTFLGGLAGPVLTLVGSTLVVLTLLAQIDALSHSAKQTSAAMAIQGLSWTRERLVAAMNDAPATPPTRAASIERLVAQHASRVALEHSRTDMTAAVQAAPVVIRLLFEYVEQLDMACSSLSPHSWPLRHERQWCTQIATFYKAHADKLGTNEQVRLGFMSELLAKPTLR